MKSTSPSRFSPGISPMIKPRSAKNQYSERLARPEKVKYLVKQVETASPKLRAGAPM
jgi:hypothetical protein